MIHVALTQFVHDPQIKCLSPCGRSMGTAMNELVDGSDGDCCYGDCDCYLPSALRRITRRRSDSALD